MIKSVSLDVDNTLFYTNTASGIAALCSYMEHALGKTYDFWEREYQRIRQRMKTEEWRNPLSYDIAYRLEVLFDELGIDADYIKCAEAYYGGELSGSQFFPEASVMVNKLKKRYKTGLTTDSPLVARGDTRYLERAGIDIADFDFVITSCGASKRTGEPYRRLAEEMRKHDIKPSEIVHVGDSAESDIEPALKAGMNAILFRPPGTSFEELLCKIESLD